MPKIITIKSAIAEYQCPGCVNGSDPETCERFVESERGCDNHHAGTFMLGYGGMALGMPKGFNRLGYSLHRIDVFASYDEMRQACPEVTAKFSEPMWVHLDEYGNTLVRWFNPSVNEGKITVTLGDCRDKFTRALEITEYHLDQMD